MMPDFVGISGAAVFEKRHLFGIAQITIGFVLHHARLAGDDYRKQATQRVGLGLTGLVDFLDDGRGSLIGFTCPVR